MKTQSEKLLFINGVGIFVSFFCNIKKPEGTSAARARDVLIGKKLNKCTLSILVANLFLDTLCNISIHWYLSCLHEIEIHFF